MTTLPSLSSYCPYLIMLALALFISLLPLSSPFLHSLVPPSLVPPSGTRTSTNLSLLNLDTLIDNAKGSEDATSPTASTASRKTVIFVTSRKSSISIPPSSPPTSSTIPPSLIITPPSFPQTPEPRNIHSYLALPAESYSVLDGASMARINLDQIPPPLSITINAQLDSPDEPLFKFTLPTITLLRSQFNATLYA